MNSGRRSGALFFPAAAGICLFLLTRPPAACADDWTTYAVPNDLKDVTVADSLVWMATTGGALSYDPVREEFTQYPRRVSGGPPSQDLTGVCTDVVSGRVFFGSADRGVVEYNPDDGRWRRFEFVPSSEINSLACLGGFVYIATRSGFSIRRTAVNADICNEIDRGCCGDNPDDCDFPSFDVRDFGLLEGQPWAATANGPAEFVDNVWAARPAAGVTDSRSIEAFDGAMFLATRDARGVFRWNKISGQWDRVAEGLREGQGLGDLVRLVTTGSEFFLACGYGLFKWNGSGWSGTGLEDQAVRSVAAVPGLRPTYYAATQAGLFIGAERGPALTWEYRPAPGPPQRASGQAVAADRSGVIWVGTLGGVMSLAADGTWTSFPNGQNGLTGSDVYSIFADSRSRLWIGKCCCFDPPQCPTQFLGGGVVSDTLTSLNGWGMSEDAAGRLWIGSNTNGLFVLDASGNQIVNLTPAITGGRLASSSVRTTAAQGNNVWLGHEQHGLQLVKTGGIPDSVSRYTWITPRGLPDDAVVDIALEGSDAWVLTSGNLVRYREDVKFNQIALNEGGEPRSGRAVVVDRRGIKWVATSSGVLRVNPDLSVEVLNTGNSDLIADDVYDAAADPVSGDVLFQTRIGTSRLRPGASPRTGTDGRYVYPNPFRPGGAVRVKIGGGPADNALVTDLVGRPVASFDPDLGWDGRNRAGDEVAPGIYIIVVDGEETLRLAVLR